MQFSETCDGCGFRPFDYSHFIDLASVAVSSKRVVNAGRLGDSSSKPSDEAASGVASPADGQDTRQLNAD